MSSFDSTSAAIQRLRSLRINCNTESNTLRIPKSARSRYSTRRGHPRPAHHTKHQTTPTEPRFAYNQSQRNVRIANHRLLPKGGNLMNRASSLTLNQQRRKRPKRRTRTFYSKKWGNRLYGMTSLGLPPRPEPQQHTTKRTQSPFVEEEYLDLNEALKTPPIESSECQVRHLCVDWRNDRQREESVTYYDSAVSNIAANTDIDQDTEYEQDHDHDVDKTQQSKFKIIVSAPNRGRHTNYIDEYDHDDEQEERRAFRARMRSKHRKRGYVGSDVESAATSDYSSCDEFDGNSTGNECEETEDDDDDEDDDDEHEDDDDDDHDVDNKSRFFLSGNDLKRGIYSTFNRDYSDDSLSDDTDYLSAQSDDFSELSICYQKNKLIKDKNIKFRESGVCHKDQFLSDVGVSDIGSSDTDWGSSADSIPDSIPPPVHSDYLTVIHR